MNNIIKKCKDLLNRSGSKAFLVLGAFLLLSFGFYLFNQEDAFLASSKAGNRELPIYNVETDQKQVSLSFDAAWGDEDTIQILDILDKYNVKATFFLTGVWIESFPDKVKEIAARGHDVANHSENHKHMNSLGNDVKKTELMKAHEKVKSITGSDMNLFRPPYGEYNNDVVKVSYECGYFPVQWSVDSLDWKDYGVDSIVKTVLQHKNLKNGAIILMHNGAKYTKDALEQVISGLQSQGYELVPISQLILKENFYMKSDGTQATKK